MAIASAVSTAATITAAPQRPMLLHSAKATLISFQHFTDCRFGGSS
jgi:hypothetical protein